MCRYLTGGVISSTAVNLFCGLLATHCMGLLLECRDSLIGRPTPRNYGDIASHVHPRARNLVRSLIIASQVGFCCVYLSFVASTSREYFKIDALSEFTQSLLAMVLVTLIVIPLTWIRELNNFRLTNLIAMIIVFTAIVAILAGSFYQLGSNGLGDDVKWGMNKNFLMFFGTSVYAFEGICMVLPIEAEMKDPSKMRPVMKWCMLTIVLVICLVGTVGYLAFSNGVEAIVLNNLRGLCNGHEWCKFCVDGLVAAYCISVTFTFPVMMVPVIKILEVSCHCLDSLRDLLCACSVG